MAASLPNANNPKRRVELLLLSMGDELKSIVRAAKLRPSSHDDNCYAVFVRNIDEYLKSMTDPAAEHEAFSNIRQEEGESAVNFHARLTEKVRLCGYSPMDQDRFVRTQLIRGLRNEELKRAARTYGHDSILIVQSATRAEAFQAEGTSSKVQSHACAVSSNRNRYTQELQKRKTEVNRDPSTPAKRFSSEQMPFNTKRPQVSRRERCSRCYRQSHRGKECPATRRTCNSYGIRGHFAIACRKSRVNVVKDDDPAVCDPKKEEQVRT